MRIKSLTIFLLCLLLLFGLPVPVIATTPSPECPDCYSWGWDGVKYRCLYDCKYDNCETCVDVGGGSSACLPCGGDPDYQCCGAGICCNTANCGACVDGDCKICGGDPDKVCCGGSCCDTSQCHRCNFTTGECENECDPDQFCCVADDGDLCCNQGQKCCTCYYVSYDMYVPYCCPSGYTCCNWDICCDPDNCETCVDGECQVCGGDPDKVCCDGSCEPKCEEEIDEPRCSSQWNEDCIACVGILESCSNHNTRIFTDAVTYTCSGGCPGECAEEPNQPVCSEVYKCKTGEFMWPYICTAHLDTPVPLDCYFQIDSPLYCSRCTTDYDKRIGVYYPPYPSKKCQ